MKVLILAVFVVLLSTLTASASSNPPGCENGRSQATHCIANFYGPVSVNGFGPAFIPCLNGGKGENVVFTSTQTTILYYTVTNGKRTGFFMTVGGGLTGTGQTTGIQYSARGSSQQSFANWMPFNADGSIDGEGQFSYTDNYYISAPGVNHIWHRTQRFENIKTGDVYTSHDDPVEVVCR